MADKVFDKLFEVMLESERETYHNDMEPFEAYMQKKKAQMHQSTDVYNERVFRGYNVIMKRLKSKTNKVKASLPPNLKMIDTRLFA